MGWLGDIESGLAIGGAVTGGPVGLGAFLAKDALDRQNAARAAGLGIPTPTINRSLGGMKVTAPGFGELLQKAIGGDYSPYAETINRGYEKLGQPLHDISDRSGITSQATNLLAENFIERVYQKTGKLPSADQVTQFVGENMTPDFAKQVISDTINPAQLNKISDMYLDVNPEIVNGLKPAADNTSLAATAQQLNQFYDPLQKYALEDVKRQFDPLRARAVEEEAALGRLRSGVSAAPNSAIGQVDVNQGNAFANVISNILGQKASGTLDLNKFNQNMGLQQQQLQNAKNEFNQTLGFNKQQYSDQMDYQNKALALQEILGRQMAANRRNRGLAGAFGGAASGAATGTAILPGWGTAIGAGLGGLGGYFSSKED